eukprot:TRINITY_DN41_c0_g1_i10.p1 TRINITY_DN41_c0_g1~~TRINITY_DN41_c0_g1_i10.p1  ORF type:complete len:336 (-),score=108.94 TRINITY_DN41_c0_g1_i10:695-1702(-)
MPRGGPAAARVAGMAHQFSGTAEIDLAERTAKGVADPTEDVVDGGHARSCYLKTESACVDETVDAPIAEVWALVRDFGGWQSWWPAFRSCAVTGEGIGQERALVYGNGSSYVEQLTRLDDKLHVLEYRLVSSKDPLPAQNVYTSVELVAAGSRATRVTWSSAFQPTRDSVAPVIRERQMEAYAAGIKALQAKVTSGPSVRPLRVSVTKASMVSSSLVAQLVIAINGTAVHKVGLTPSGTPMTHDLVTLQLKSVDDTLELALEKEDGSVVAKGTIAASALLPTAEGPSQVTLDVDLGSGGGEDGKPVATYTLSVINASPPCPSRRRCSCSWLWGAS